MSNFEHRIKEDSTEFEKAFLKIYDGNMWRAIEKMKDWQPPNKLVEVPQFVADWFEKNKHDIEYRIWNYSRLSDRCIRDEFFKWFDKNSNKPIETLIRMKLEGYTVEKEQLFYLKNKITQEYLYDNDGHFSECGKEALGFDMFKVEFTKSEIEDMETGSYEQIEVEP